MTVTHPTRGFDLGELRYVAARYARLLITARRQFEPDFLPEDVQQQWDLRGNIDRSDLSAADLLYRAAQTLARLNTEFIPRGDSGGIAVLEQQTVVDRLMVNVGFLVSPVGTGPSWNQELLHAVEALRNGDSVNWRELVDWSLLAEIRQDLNRLPEPVTAHEPESDSADEYRFVRQGNDWLVQFGGRQAFLVRDLIGMYYLYLLVQSPGKRFLPTELRGAWNRFAANGGNRSAVTADVIAGESAENTPTSTSDDGEMIDAEALRAYRDQLATLEDEIEQAKARGQNREAAELEEEHRFIRDQIEAAVPFSQRSQGRRDPKIRKLGRSEKKDRDAVIAALKTAIKNINGVNPKAGKFFSQATDWSDLITYDPASSISWEIK